MRSFGDKCKTIATNFLWFMFIVVGMGQIGPLIGCALAYWDGASLFPVIDASAGRAELLTCAIAILAGATFFLVREYTSYDSIRYRRTKSLLLLLSVVVGALCILMTAVLLISPGFARDTQRTMHWMLYAAAIATSLLLYFVDESQDTSQDATQRLAASSEELTASSNRQTTPDGIKL